MTIFRLNYAIDMQYGVLLEIARSVNEGREIDLSMGHANVIWQGDANEYAIRSLLIASVPPAILNVTGLKHYQSVGLLINSEKCLIKSQYLLEQSSLQPC